MYFSLILPIYNVEAYLRECLSLILNQSFTDFECLMIDDGSTDGSANICKSFENQDVRFKYHYKDNGGLSDARNYGLCKSSGEYIVFIDSDDVVSSELLSIVRKCIDQHEADIVYFDYLKFYSELPALNATAISENCSLISNAELAQKPNFAWARIARKTLYENNLFPVGLIYEDVFTSPILSAKAKRIVYIKNALYGYRKRPNSITTGSAERQFGLFETVHQLKKYIIENQIGYEYYSTALVNLIQSCLVSLVRINEPKKRRLYTNLIVEEYKDLTICDIWGSYSLNKFKLLTLLSKNRFTLILLSVILRPVVLFSDRKGK